MINIVIEFKKRINNNKILWSRNMVMMIIISMCTADGRLFGNIIQRELKKYYSCIAGCVAVCT